MSLFKLPKSSEGSTATSQPDLILALDIGSSFVKSAFGRISLKRSHKSDSTKSLQLLGFSKVAQRPGNISGGLIADIPGTIASCEDAVSALESSTGEKANSCIVGISGELVKGDTTTIRYRRDNPNKPITDAELKELLEKIESRAEKKVKKELALETDNPEINLSLINSALVSLSIDGYRINNPVVLAVKFHASPGLSLHQKIFGALLRKCNNTEIKDYVVHRRIIGNSHIQNSGQHPLLNQRQKR